MVHLPVSLSTKAENGSTDVTISGGGVFPVLIEDQNEGRAWLLRAV